jgi:hypothetical protein
MNDYEPTRSHEILPDPPTSDSTTRQSVARGSGGPAAVPPASPGSSPDSSTSSARLRKERWAGVWRMVSNRVSGWIVAAALACAVVGLSVALAASSTASGAAHGFVPGGGVAGGPAAAGGGSNARSGPAEGGASGTVDSVSTSGFTLSTSAGQKVTVDEAPSTTYRSGTSSASTSASDVRTGRAVLVLGTTSGTSITAAQVIVQPTSRGAASSSAAQVVPFQQGAPTTSKEVGQIPANYSEGSGTIVSGTAADKATEAALAAYPGGVVDRVVKLSNGEFEVHNIGVNWPHHVFVNQGFTVVGAD